jgi:Transposase DDE domain group 1
VGEAQEPFFEPSFNRSVKVLVGDERLTSDAGVLLLREADQRLQLIASLASGLRDSRDEDQVRYPSCVLLRQRIYSLALGYQAQDDLDRLAHDPALRMASWDQPGEDVLQERLASQPTHSRLIHMLAHDRHNLQCLRGALADWVERHLRAYADRAVRQGTIDVDSFPIEVHGKQAGAAYNGYFQATVYHPLVASFSTAGDYDSGREGKRLGQGFVHAMLRRGECHTAEGVLRFLDHVLRIAPRLAYQCDLRLDAGFTSGHVLDYLTRRNVRFVGRLKSNPVLDALAEPHLWRPAGRPPRGGYEDVVELGLHQAEPWEFAQRLLLVVVDRPDPRSGQLLLEPDYFFLVTNYDEQQRDGPTILEHYRRRGTFEDRFGEFNQALGAQLSSPQFHENEATFLLCLLAFNLTNLLREELEDSLGSCWDLKRFRNYVLKAGGRVVKHSRRLVMHLAQAVVQFWSRVTDRIAGWRLAPRFGRVRGPTARAGRPPPRHAHLSEVLRD